MARKNKDALFSDLPAQMRSAVPRKLMRQLAPSNPHAKISFHKTTELMMTRQMGASIRDKQLANIRANSAWLLAFEMLEAKGLHTGLHVSELAEAQGVSVSTAKRTMLRAEQIIYEIYGINISFLDRNGVWRLATEREVALKYAQMLRSIKTVSSRVKMYQGAAAKHGKKDGRVALPLFKMETQWKS